MNSYLFLSMPVGLRASFLSALFCVFAAGCISQVNEAPCEPQPPCLPANNTPFGFNFQLQPDKLNAEWLLSPNSNPANNPYIEITAIHGIQQFNAQFANPRKLEWKTTNSFQTYLFVENQPIDTLLFVVLEKKVDCCPQMVIHKIYRNGKRICADYQPGKPVKL